MARARWRRSSRAPLHSGIGGHARLWPPLDITLVTASTLRLMELEITEPNLLLHQGGPGAVRGLVDALLARL